MICSMNDQKMTKLSAALLVCGCLTLSSCGEGQSQGEVAGDTAPDISLTQEDTGVSAPAAHGDQIDDAFDSEVSEVRHAASHQHGDANLAIVLEDKTLTLELETPLFNLTGFEHAPETEEEIAAVEAAEAKLKQPETLFLMKEQAECERADNDLEIHLGEDEHDDHDEHEDTDEAHHDDDHDDDHDEHDDAEEVHHEDALITYTFECAAPEKLSEIDIALLQAFPNMTELEVAYLGPNSQSVFTVDQRNTSIRLDK